MIYGNTLLQGCAQASTRAESSYRVDYPNSKERASRIIALDEPAAEIMRGVSEEPWKGARFLTFVEHISVPGVEAVQIDATLRAPDGTETTLSDELQGADVAVMIATAGESAEAAAVIGNACFVRNIMTAGLICTNPTVRGTVDRAVRALRPYASVLVVASGTEYVPELLTALRA